MSADPLAPQHKQADDVEAASVPAPRISLETNPDFLLKMSATKIGTQPDSGLQDEEKHEEQSNITHEALVKLTREAIKEIIESDPLLNDLPTDPTIDEIKAQIAVAQGQAITLFLKRSPLPTLSIVVR